MASLQDKLLTDVTHIVAVNVCSLSLLDSVAGMIGLQDSTLIMQLLRDNLTLWTSDGEGVEA